MEQVQKKKSSFSSEHILQLECIAWFRNYYERFGAGCIIPVPNELARKRKDIVIKDGCSDLIIALPGETIYVELKVGYNSQQDNQIEFEKLILNLNQRYFVIKSLQDFKTLIDNQQPKHKKL